MTSGTFTVAIFPFLRTSAELEVGGHIFRSTLDIANLPDEQAQAVVEIRNRLFTRGDYRIKSASYTIVPKIDFNAPGSRLGKLAHVRAVLAYLYSNPHEVFENLFLHPEEVSLVLLTPGKISRFLVEPHDYAETVAVASASSESKDKLVFGYSGLYNLKHHFWSKPDERLYGPKPNMALMGAQDLYHDIRYLFPRRHDYQLLLDFLELPLTPALLRIYAALDWYNAANEDGLGRHRELLNLAVAFETLLRLPASDKTDRLVDAITLILGRTDRLDQWAKQFYAARSQVAHEGEVRDRYFYVPNTSRSKHLEDLSGSLMLYGRHIFQLCLGTLLVGIDLATRADLQEKFISNNERYDQICKILVAKDGKPAEKIASLQPVIRSLSRYQFIPAGELSRAAMLNAIKHSAICLIEGNLHPTNLSGVLKAVADIKKKDDDLQKLSAINDLVKAFEEIDSQSLTVEAKTVSNLVQLTWGKLFEIYYWLKSRGR